MNILDIAKTIGAAAFSVAVPGGAAILAGVNQLLPEGSKLPETATGNDVRATVSALPPEQRASVMEKQFDVDMTQIKESNDTLRVMLQSDAASPHSTRPRIAWWSFWLVALVTVVVVSLWAYGVGVQNDSLVKTVMDGWPFVASLVAPFVLLLRSYFGVLKQEQQNRLDAASGNSTATGLSGIISSVINRK